MKSGAKTIRVPLRVARPTSETGAQGFPRSCRCWYILPSRQTVTSIQAERAFATASVQAGQQRP